jgi:hypothetical protein
MFFPFPYSSLLSSSVVRLVDLSPLPILRPSSGLAYVSGELSFPMFLFKPARFNWSLTWWRARLREPALTYTAFVPSEVVY